MTPNKIIQNSTLGNLANLQILKMASMRFSHIQCLEFAQFCLIFLSDVKYKLTKKWRKNLFYSDLV